MPGDAERVDRPVAPNEALDRHRVEHFVGDDHAVEPARQPIEPFDAIEQPGHGRGQGLLLALAQVGTDVQDPVAARQRVAPLEFVQHRRRHDARARAEFEHVAAAEGLQDLGALHGETAAEHRRHLGRGDEVAGGAELASAGAVVAEPRLVQRDLHEAGETDPAAGALDLLAQPRAEPLAVRSLLGRQVRQLQRDAQAANPRAATPRNDVRYRQPVQPPAAHRHDTMDSTLPLADRCVLVTGGAKRLGAAIGRQLHASGASLVVHYHQSRTSADALVAEFEALRPGSALAVRADLHEVERLPALVAAAVSRFGRLDVLVNNASTFYPTPVGTITDAQFDDLVGTNLRAPLFLSQAAAPALAPRRA